MKELNAEESQKVLDLFDEMCELCGGEPFQPILKQLNSFLEHVPNKELIWESILKDISKAIGGSFVAQAEQLTAQMKAPDGLAQMKAAMDAALKTE